MRERTRIVQCTAPRTPADVLHADEQVAPHGDLLELRLDEWTGTAEELGAVLERVRAPLIVTDRPPSQGGRSPRTAPERAALLHAAAPPAAFVDLEADAPHRHESFAPARTGRPSE